MLPRLLQNLEIFPIIINEKANKKFFMLNLSFDKEKGRQIILENFNNPTHKVPLTRLQKISNSLDVPFHIFTSLSTSCGDTIYLLIQKKNNLIELARFASEQQACCLTAATTNILCH